MGRGYDVICKECETGFTVNEGSGMSAMPFRCDRCGKEWWWEFGPGGPFDKEANPAPCKCGGTSSAEAPPRCPKCGSLEWERDPEGMEIMYD